MFKLRNVHFVRPTPTRNSTWMLHGQLLPFLSVEAKQQKIDWRQLRSSLKYHCTNATGRVFHQSASVDNMADWWNELWYSAYSVDRMAD